jgi:AdoMet dependent proline di-methyltransferase
VEADLFEWAPDPSAYDACVFTFWLSHVPADRFAPFWDRVARALKPDGRVFFIDSARTGESTASDHRLPDEGEMTMTRRLDDGREFQVIKRFYEPERLTRELSQLGWNCRIGTTGEFFIHGTATRAE